MTSRKVGFASLIAFMLFLVPIILSFIFDSNIRQSLSNVKYAFFSTMLTKIIFLDFTFLLIAISTLGNKLVKILLGVPVGLIVIFFIIYFTISKPHRIKGASMEPNIKNKYFVIGNPSIYRFSSPKRGDIVIFKSKIDSSDQINRIVGLPGEYVSIRNGEIYINNIALDEPYLNPDTKTEQGYFLNTENKLIPNNSYAILGDNRNHSSDSRGYGFIDKKLIKEKIFFIYWPKEDFGFVK